MKIYLIPLAFFCTTNMLCMEVKPQSNRTQKFNWSDLPHDIKLKIFEYVSYDSTTIFKDCLLKTGSK